MTKGEKVSIALWEASKEAWKLMMIYVEGKKYLGGVNSYLK